MASQTDLDQGGTSRQWVRTYLGPSVGWIYLPGSNRLVITVAGTYTAIEGTSLVTVDIAGAVTIILPSAINPTVPAIAIATPYAAVPITIVDVGGFAGAHPITIEPASSAENVLGLASIQLTAAYGAIALKPNNGLKGWTSWSG